MFDCLGEYVRCELGFCMNNGLFDSFNDIFEHELGPRSNTVRCANIPMNGKFSVASPISGAKKALLLT